MPKRLALNGLISFIETITTQESVNNEMDHTLNPANTQFIDKINFKTMDWGEIKTITDFPKKCKQIFDPFISKIKRYGTIDTFGNDNISLYFSVLFCLVDKFSSLDRQEQENFVNEFKQKLALDIIRKDLFKKFGYKELKWSQKDLKECIMKCKNNKLVLRYIAEYFNINIFLVNILEDRIYAIYPEEQFNVYKMNLFLTFYDGIFEPLVYEKKLWKYNDSAFKRLIVVNQMHIHTFNYDTSTKPIEFKKGPEDLLKYDDRIKPTIPEKLIVKEIVADTKVTDTKGAVTEENNYDEVFTNNESKTSWLNDMEETETEIEMGSTVNVFVKNK